MTRITATVATDTDYGITGGAVLDVSGFLGEVAGVGQITGGVAQAIGGGGWHNVIAGTISLGSGVLISKALKNSIPRSWHGEKLASARMHNRIVGNLLGAAMNLSDWLAPKEVQCAKR